MRTLCLLFLDILLLLYTPTAALPFNNAQIKNIARQSANGQINITSSSAHPLNLSLYTPEGTENWAAYEPPVTHCDPPIANNFIMISDCYEVIYDILRDSRGYKGQTWHADGTADPYRVPVHWVAGTCMVTMRPLYTGALDVLPPVMVGWAAAQVVKTCVIFSGTGGRATIGRLDVLELVISNRYLAATS